MFSSKNLMLLTIILMVYYLSYSQTKVSDSIYYRNEITLNAAPAFSVYSSGKAPEAIIAIGYAHNFGRNHFLRTGVKIIPDIRRTDENTIDDYLNSKINDNNWKPNGNGSIVMDSLNADYFSSRESKISLYLGYDHLIGRKKWKFLMGIELLIGFNTYSASQSTYGYDITHTPDTVNNVYSSTFDFKEYDISGVNTIGLHLGFTPRLGTRWDISKRIALTIVYAPVFYFDMSPYQYTTSLNNARLSLYGGIFVADASLIIKL